MLPWSANTILVATLVIFAAMIAIFVLHILLEVQQLVRLGEMRRDYVREKQAHLASLYGERWGLRTEIESERLEQSKEETEEPKSLPVAGRYQEQVQNLEIQQRASKLEEQNLRFEQDYKKLEEDLKQVREHQREADQERERIMEELQNIRRILNGKPSSKVASAAYSKVYRLLSLPKARGER